MAEVEVCPAEELPPGTMRLVSTGPLEIGVYNCGGDLVAIEDRCSHDDGPLVEGEWEPELCTVICPRHGSHFDLLSGEPLSGPANRPLTKFRVKVEGSSIFVAPLRDAHTLGQAATTTGHNPNE